MSGSSSGRWFLAAAGIPLWLASFFAPSAEDVARTHYLCHDDTIAQPCFRDGLPVEIMLLPFLLLTTYPFARFAFTLFSQGASHGCWSWSYGDIYPVELCLALAGLFWNIWAFLAIGMFVPPLHWLRIYRGMMILWFAAGALLALQSHKRDLSTQSADPL